MSDTLSTARLEARINPELHRMLKRAAELQGSTVTGFVISAIQQAVKQTLEEYEVIRLSFADQQNFAQAVLHPPRTAPALKKAFARRDRLLSAE
ncbi:MAG: DUF1778 domain-containing protein [Desulfovibrio sp.]|nr:DUF1778 domain-containing protein [Desulfovibrio sp.]